ncbi:MAG: DNA polymerase III subunit chi [Alphaproteobacteria bacterium]|nr:DNA polymerase III subunit chi [Alphaproteobacteria bacterium]QQS57362.1 MAG: DNA polymerase III subunit chi [Alphaproteobacteria bacterium]
MAEVRFYHLQSQRQEDALPSLISKALEGGHRLVVRLRDEAQVARINEHLWTFRPESFIPHGSAKDGNAALQPVWLTHLNDNPNQATVLIVGQGAEASFGDEISVACEMLDGGDDEAVGAARARWKAYKEAGHTVTYWQQNERGGWEKKG